MPIHDFNFPPQPVARSPPEYPQVACRSLMRQLKQKSTVRSGLSPRVLQDIHPVRMDASHSAEWQSRIKQSVAATFRLGSHSSLIEEGGRRITDSSWRRLTRRWGKMGPSLLTSTSPKRTRGWGPRWRGVRESNRPAAIRNSAASAGWSLFVEIRKTTLEPLCS